ncbi:hypothetical protein Micant_00002 [Erwinia phage Micant]|uniref:Uncharacterized protein n=1 Tax=Erwinia phage Micant TaxID=2923255 RepID=A0AAE9JVB5_9CAUD|nr:hypothetical protein Micant_00002 [Erwinia phage Micant]
MNTFRDVLLAVGSFWLIVFLLVWGVVQYV